MRLLAEERQTGTLALLYSSPVHDREIVLGQVPVGARLPGADHLLATVYMPLLILVNGKVSFGHVAAGYLGLLLLGSASLAIGTFGSALARTQVLAAIFSGCMLVALVLLLAAGAGHRAAAVGRLHRRWRCTASTSRRSRSGSSTLRDVVYYLALTYVALFGATRVLEARRWR